MRDRHLAIMRAFVVVLVALIATTGSDSDTVEACPIGEPTVLNTVERMTTGDFTGTLILLSLFLGLITLTFIRGRVIFRAVRQTRSYEREALSALFIGRFEEALRIGSQFPASPVAAVVAASFEQSQYFSHSNSSPLRSSRTAFQRAALTQIIALKRSLWMLAAIGGSVPVLGLANVLLSSSDSDRSSALLLGVGLLVSVPALWLFLGLASEVELLVQRIDRLATSIIDQIVKQASATTIPAYPIDKAWDHRALFGACDLSSASITISGSVLPTLIYKPSSSTRTI